MPTNVERKLQFYPPKLGDRLLAVRALIHDIAANDTSIGRLEESLKWGQISFATMHPKSGTPIRIDGDMEMGTYSVYVPCRANVITGFRAVHPDMFTYHGNREIRLDLNVPMPEKELTLFLNTALRYYL